MRLRAPEAIYPQVFYFPVPPGQYPAADIRLVQEALTYLSFWWARLNTEEKIFILGVIMEILKKSTGSAVEQLREWLDKRRRVGPLIA
jgi:hypothetical protein